MLTAFYSTIVHGVSRIYSRVLVRSMTMAPRLDHGDLAQVTLMQSMSRQSALAALGTVSLNGNLW